jgi:predicted RND superfamily exporter protein
MNGIPNFDFRRLANFSFRFHRWLLLSFFLFLALSIFLVIRLRPQSDVAHLLPSHAPKTQAFISFLKQFGASDSLFVALETKGGEGVESFMPFAEMLADELAATGAFKEIRGRMNPSERKFLENQFVRKALLYLTEKDLREIESRLSTASIRKRIRELKTTLASPLGSWILRGAVQDPLGLWPIFQKYLPAAGLSSTKGVFLSPDRKMILLVGNPKGTAPDIAYDKKLMGKILEAQTAARKKFLSANKEPRRAAFNNLRIGLAGGYISALEDAQMIKKELAMNFSVSLIAVLIIFSLAFRRSLAFLYAFFPLLASPLLTLGLFAHFLGRLSESTAAFSAILVGLSIDFIILLYGRYLEERNAGMEILGSLERSLGSTGKAVWTGAATTAAAYFALLLSDFRGIRELGYLTGTGILISLFCAFCIFPALVVWRERNHGRKEKFSRVFSFGLERLGPLALKHPKGTTVLCAGLTVALLGGIWRVDLNNDPRTLRPPDQKSLLLEERIREKMSEGLETVTLIARDATSEAALEKQGQLRNRIEKSISSGLPILRYESLAAYLPPLSLQKRNLEWIRTRQMGAFDSKRIRREFQGALRRAGLRSEPFEGMVKKLEEMLHNREPITWNDFRKSPLGEAGDRFLKKTDGSVLSAGYLQVKPGFWEDPRTAAFLEDLQKTFPDLQVTGSGPVRAELEILMKKESWMILGVALVAVFFLIYLDFRSWRLTLVTLLPVALASLWTLGLMGFFRISLNFMNLVVFTMVLGIAVDYGLHILHRGLEDGTLLEGAGLRQVGKGVALAALTTLAGFGSLILSGYPGLRSMGVVALMGVGFSGLISLTLLPVLLQKELKNREGVRREDKRQ